MQKLTSIVFLLLVPSLAHCQFKDLDSATRKLFQNVKTVRESTVGDSTSPITVVDFNPDGRPSRVVQYSKDMVEQQKEEFSYDPHGCLVRDNTYQAGKLFSTIDYIHDAIGRELSSEEFVYSSADGEKLPMRASFREYYANNKLRKLTTLELPKRDTTETDYFDSAGYNSNSVLHISGLRAARQIYHWNSARSEMQETEYDDQGEQFNSIYHRYENNREIERLDSLTMPQPLYWKYDANGRLLETNADVFYIKYYYYDTRGYLTSGKLRILYSDTDQKDLPKDIFFKYDYTFRK